MTPAPITLFTYNRLYHTRKTVEALQKNKLSAVSDLIVFSDGPKEGSSGEQIQQVRNYLKTIQHFKSVRIVERKSNYGLAANIVDGVSEIISQYGKVVVLEDDLVTSPFFLDYMNDGLRLYENDENVISMHGFLLPVNEALPNTFFLRGADCNGWATWKRGWDIFQPDANLLLQRLVESNQCEEFDFNGSFPFVQMLKDQVAGKVSSWAIRWYASAFLENKYTLYPGKSLVSNIGGDGSGTNHGFDYSLPAAINLEPLKVSRIEVRQNADAYLAIANYYRKVVNPPLWNKIRRRLRIALKP